MLSGNGPFSIPTYSFFSFLTFSRYTRLSTLLRSRFNSSKLIIPASALISIVYRLLREMSSRSSCRNSLSAWMSRSIFLDRFKTSISRKSRIGVRSSMAFPQRSRYFRLTAYCSPSREIIPLLLAESVVSSSSFFSVISVSSICRVLAIAARSISSCMIINIPPFLFLYAYIIPQKIKI